MAAATHHAEPERFTRSDLLPVRLETLPLLLVALYVATVVLAFVPVEEGRADRLWAAGLAPFVGVGLVLLRQSKPWLAGALFVSGVFVLWLAALWLGPGELAVWTTALVIGSASCLFGPRSALLFTALASSAILAAGLDARVSAAGVMAGVVLCWVQACLFWLTARPSATALEWAWASYVEARGRQDQLRERQGELNSVLKTLDLAYHHLEHLNDELNRARRIAEEARRLKAEFAANISHELRTPLNLILGFSEMMVKTPHTYGPDHLPPAYQADIDAIYRNAGHLAGLIDDVLDLSQVEAGRMGLVREPTSLAEVVEEAVRAVIARFQSVGLSLEVDAPADLPSVLVDRTRIRQVLINLLNNAARFTDVGGARIEIRKGENELVVSVRDTGIGIAAEDLPHVFAEFYQTSSASQRRSGGSGLGLPISKRLVELHGGVMWVESTAGRGAAFFFSLPMAATVVTGSLPGEWEIWDRVSTARGVPEPAVALVANDETVARLFRRYLDGYRVMTVQDLGAVNSLSEEASVRGVIVAADTPDECWNALGNLDAVATELPIAVTTIAGDRRRAAELDVSGFLAKPLLRTQVARVLERFGSGVRTILVVDDSADMVRLLARTIRSLGRKYRVLQATSGSEALAIMAERVPDAVLLDLLMPEVDGYTVLRAMRADERLRAIPVVAVSAHAIAAEAPAVGFLGLVKRGGFSTDETTRCLKSCFDALQPAVGARSGQEPQAASAASPVWAGAQPPPAEAPSPLA